jgi:hypothetical protein
VENSGEGEYLMSWLKKLFGGGTASGGDCGPGVVDLRSGGERQMARDAGKALSGSDESAARSLCRLAGKSQKMGDAKFNEMTRVGEQLFARGGHALMQRVCYRVKALGGSYTYVSTAWNGVGEWMD